LGILCAVLWNTGLPTLFVIKGYISKLLRLSLADIALRDSVFWVLGKKIHSLGKGIS